MGGGFDLFFMKPVAPVIIPNIPVIIKAKSVLYTNALRLGSRVWNIG
ncbi:MAG: hypothetical protein ABGF52_09455 [Candidatus Asgardarchaeum sp.]